jgi:hypothetical protein
VYIHKYEVWQIYVDGKVRAYFVLFRGMAGVDRKSIGVERVFLY